MKHTLENQSLYIGKSFNRLTINSFIHKNNRWRVICECICGKEITAVFDSVIRGSTKSCGCLRIEKSKANCRIAGKSNKGKKPSTTTYDIESLSYFEKKAYNSWKALKRRCKDKNNNRYEYYGEKGISVDSRWLEKGTGFINFLNDMGCPILYELSIDRINIDQNYTKNNCRWSTILEQANNKSNNIFVEFNNKKLTLSQWAVELNIPMGTLWSRLFVLNWTIEKTFITTNCKSSNK